MKVSPNSRLINQANLSSRVIYELAQTIFSSRKPADRLLRKFFRQNKKFGSSDRRFISESTYSLLRWWGWLRVLAGSDERFWTDSPIKMTTNLGWVSMLLAANILDSIELHPIAVHWKELLRKKRRFPNFIEGLYDTPLPYRARQINELFGISSGGEEKVVPDWFMRELQAGDTDSLQVLEFLQKRPPLWLRAQTENISEFEEELRNVGLHVQQSSTIKNAFYLHRPRINLYDLALFRDGKFEVQDLASQIIGIACNPKAGERWWDVCAGAGGKSLQLSCIMKNKGLVVATDIRPWKLTDLKKRAKRSRLFNITTKEWNGKGIPARTPNFDGVLADVPCSGTGTWRRNPDGRWNLRENELMTFPDMQYGILTNAAKGVKRGGILVYATCSMCPCENEDVVNKFLAENTDFLLESLVHPLTGKKVNGMVKVWPQISDSDASFVARMKKRVD